MSLLKLFLLLSQCIILVHSQAYEADVMARNSRWGDRPILYGYGKCKITLEPLRMTLHWPRLKKRLDLLIPHINMGFYQLDKHHERFSLTEGSWSVTFLSTNGFFVLFYAERKNRSAYCVHF